MPIRIYDPYAKKRMELLVHEASKWVTRNEFCAQTGTLNDDITAELLRLGMVKYKPGANGSRGGYRPTVKGTAELIAKPQGRIIVVNMPKCIKLLDLLNAPGVEQH